MIAVMRIVAQDGLAVLSLGVPYARRIMPSPPAKFYVSPALHDIYPHAHRPLPHCFSPAILAVVPLQPLTYTFGRAVRETMRALGGSSAGVTAALKQTISLRYGLADRGRTGLPRLLTWHLLIPRWQDERSQATSANAGSSSNESEYVKADHERQPLDAEDFSRPYGRCG